MVNPNMAGEDASLDSAVSAIAAKLRGGADVDSQVDTRESREERDPIERQQTTDLEESERLEREAQAGQQDEGESHAEAETGEAEKAEAEAEAFIELPPAEEGGEAERIPVNEAVEAVKQLRQMNGDIATAVIKAEEEAYQKQDRITQQISGTFAELQRQAKAAIETMYLYAPQAPDPIMLDRNSGYYNPEEYHLAKMRYDEFAAHYGRVFNTLKQAEQGSHATTSHVGQEEERRETDRASRFIPEYKDPKTRETWRADALEVLNQRYGVTKEMMDDIVDHRALRIINDLVKTIKAEKKAPEVKKHLQETKPKIVNGRASPARDNQTGRFVGEARKAHQKQGTEASFASMLMKSGALKDLL